MEMRLSRLSREPHHSCSHFHVRSGLRADWVMEMCVEMAKDESKVPSLLDWLSRGLWNCNLSSNWPFGFVDRDDLAQHLRALKLHI